jgi:hypothetical protein
MAIKAILFFIFIYLTTYGLDGMRAMTVGAWMGTAGFFFTQQSCVDGNGANLLGLMTLPA